ncbi:zinc transporter ZupT [Acetanaerobacterium elongatum]|nr:zinc transporter ZupT [Acetanaerobacterium elongatum]
MDFMKVLPPFLLTLAAGLCTGLGGLVALFVKKENPRVLPFSLGFAAGVMIMVSTADLLPEAARLIGRHTRLSSGLIALFAMSIGMLLASLIEKKVPSESAWLKDGQNNRGIFRVGVVTALAIVLHNLPEGVATFMAGYRQMSLGLSVAVAISLHNIPEGISIAVPVYCATGKRGKALRYAFLSGLSEPLGALLAMFLLRPLLTDTVLGFTFGVVAGIMLYISFAELVPSAYKNVKIGIPLLGVLFGIVVMAAGLLIFGL